MIFIETRGNDNVKPKNVCFSEAMLSPSASFGGLYAPQNLPTIDADFILELSKLDYIGVAKTLIQKIGVDIDEELLNKALSVYKDFDDTDVVPVKSVGNDLYVCELWHGPTRAFKDMALQPFGVVFSEFAKRKQKKYLVMTATSGDTGPAALSCLKDRENVKVVCLYPDGGTSDVQRLQMLDLNKNNLKVIAVNGTFDDAQNTLKAMISDEAFLTKANKLGYEISAANSVNFGRILFQTVYHFYTYLKLLKDGVITIGEQINIIVPSGNFGNALGGYYAKRMGLPIAKITIASNSNDVLTEFLQTGTYDLSNRKLQKTIAPAMDILISSNIERIIFDKFGSKRTKELMNELSKNKCYTITKQELEALQVDFEALSGTDKDASNVINAYLKNGYLMDPHTALGIHAYKKCGKKCIAYSTAEWTKFAPDIALALGSSKMSDKDAIAFIEKTANVKTPQAIKNLLDNNYSVEASTNIEDIEKQTLDFL